MNDYKQITKNILTLLYKKPLTRDQIQVLYARDYNERLTTLKLKNVLVDMLEKGYITRLTTQIDETNQLFRIEYKGILELMKDRH